MSTSGSCQASTFSAVIQVTDTSDLTAVSAIYGEVSVVQIIWTDSRG